MKHEFMEIPLSEITPDPKQPRRAFDEEGLETLANSIKRFGVLQPVVVRKEGEGYLLIAGERRWRASQLAGLDTIPAVVRALGKHQKDTYLESLSENLQRTDLNPVEKARALKRVQDTLGWTHEEIARELGMGRASVSNSLRLLSMGEEVLDFLENSLLSEGHIRPMVTVENPAVQLALAQEAAKNRWSVRKMELECRLRAKPQKVTNARPQVLEEAPLSENPLYRSAAEALEEYFATKVEVRVGKSSCQLVIHFYDDNMLLDILSKFPLEETL